MINTLLLSAVLQQNVQLTPADLLSRVRTSYSKVSSAQYTLTSRVASHGFDKPLISNVHFGGGVMEVQAFVGTGMVGQIKINRQTISATSGPRGQYRVAYSSRAMMDSFPCNLETISFLDFDRQLNAGQGGAMNGSRLAITRKKEGAVNWFVLSEKANGVGTVTYFIDPSSFLIMRTTSANEQGQVETDAMISGLKLQKR
jgi:hypothetical protein